MAYELGKITDENGRFFGWQWAEDAFDRYQNRFLPKHLNKNFSHSKTTKIAVDIGCGLGNRAFKLATLGLFDRVVAVDLNNQASAINQQNALLHEHAARCKTPAVEIEFQKASSATLSPASFEGGAVIYINFRNALHFQSPTDVRMSLDNIAAFAAPNALVSISFDAATDKKFEGSVLSIYDDAASFNPEDTDCAPYTKYYPDSIESYLNERRFRLLKFNVDQDVDLRSGEHHILALAPGKLLTAQL